jgi:hypothetical protein
MKYANSFLDYLLSTQSGDKDKEHSFYEGNVTDITTTEIMLQLYRKQ